MEPKTIQQLLLDALTFANKTLTPKEFDSINRDKISYRVSGETDMLEYYGESFTIQSYVYSDKTRQTIILAHGQSYWAN